ncbi:hypothetical protein ACFWN7_13930 [Agromyces sp. NPDC058484]|uniref:hypothetical protein n=1 Tax=Agromyces sp. NPDC058484 TaxID=3346524 RepID=UPI00365B7884
METPKYLQTLWSYKWLLAFGLVVAVVAGFFAGFTIVNGQLESRAVKSFTAGTTVLVTSPSDTLYQAQVPERAIQEGVVPPEPLDLAASTQIYAYLVTGAGIRGAVETAVGPLDEDTESISAIRRTTQPAGDERFPGSLKLPVLEIFATAATEPRAEEITAAATEAFLGYVTAQQDAQAIPVENRVQLAVLTEGQAVEAETSNPAIPIVVTGFSVFLGFVALAFIIAGIRSDRAKRRKGARRRNGERMSSSNGQGPTASETSPVIDDADEVLVGAGIRTN